MIGRRLAWLVVSALALLPRAATAQEVVESYGTDALGSVRIVFDVNGNVVGRMDYGPFGEQVTISTVGHKSYAGLFRDGEAGLDYAEARSFQVRTGRFNAPDPVYAGLFAPQAWNRYTYALNNPTSFTDPSGEQAQANCGSVVQTGEGERVFRVGITCDGAGGGGTSWNLNLFNLSSPIFFEQRGTGSGRQSEQGGGRGRTRGSTTPPAPPAAPPPATPAPAPPAPPLPPAPPEATPPWVALAPVAECGERWKFSSLFSGNTRWAVEVVAIGSAVSMISDFSAATEKLAKRNAFKHNNLYASGINR